MALTKNYLCSPAILMDNSFINANVETSVVKIGMLRVQSLYIEPILGTPLFKKILLDIQNDSVAGNYITLLNEYILPCFFAYCEFKLAPHINTEIRNKAVGKASDGDVSAASEPELNYIRNFYEKDAKKFEARLIGYLCDDAGTMFPEYIESITDNEQVAPITKKYGNGTFLV